MRTSIIIPNWNGRQLLEKNLPAVLATKSDEVIVVDDASPDDSNELLVLRYPSIKIVKHQQNMGFAVACNSGIQAAENEIVILLNLDVLPEPDFLKYTLLDFEDPNIFAVSFNEPNWSWARIFWERGFIGHEPGPKTKETHISAWASGGSAAFRKSTWEKLGGFDEIYKPFYWEDIDLGYRAWKKGYKVLWEPKAIVHHQHEAIIGKYFSEGYVNFVSERNRLLFIWKNITSPKMVFEHKLWLGRRLLATPGYWKPFLAALGKLPPILPRRFKEWQDKKLSNEQIFTLFA